MKPPTKSPSLHAAMRRKSFATLGRLSHLLARAQHAGGLRVWTPPLAIPAASLQKRRRRASNRQTKPVGVTLSAGPDRRSDEVARLEAALYVAREPLTTRRLAKLARLTDGTRARTLLKELKRLHESSGSAFRVEQIAGGFQLLTRAPFGPWVRRLFESQPTNRLSTAALETLAIVAYRQPVTRAEIESIRGVGCEEMLRQLLDRDFVSIGGRTEEIGRPNVYLTTKHFLKAFGLGRIEELPPIAESPCSGLPVGQSR
ncbi:MAG: SMC-Scp complex subunit ScpB [Planctomycetota bacterium]|jgi:segregation and condensation protein B|nr:MAG: SMC-Scp complex subunit ScpB [Planctomycetota bacterium]